MCLPTVLELIDCTVWGLNEEGDLQGNWRPTQHRESLEFVKGYFGLRLHSWLVEHAR